MTSAKVRWGATTSTARAEERPVKSERRGDATADNHDRILPGNMLDRLEFKRTPGQQLRLMIVALVVVGWTLYVAMTTHDPVYRVAGWLGVGLLVAVQTVL